jgi:FAD/FMN-containing dehydrogenase
VQFATSPSTISIPELRDTLNGRVIAPGDPDYDQARTVFVGGIDRHPAVIVKAADASDVARVVVLARETELALAVRSGGHSTAGHGVCEGGIVLDLSGMNALDIDVDHHTAWAQTGLTAGQYTTAAGAYDLATGFGDTGSVGIGGLTLGGGIGYLVRKHGLTVDDLLAAEIVTADGRLLRTDPETHPDLFWAIRGGGGNFGVATRFQYHLHPVGHVVGGMLLLPATPEAGQRAVAPFRMLATPIADLVRPMPYPEIYPRTMTPSTRPRWATRCSWTPSTSRSPGRSWTTCRPPTRRCGSHSCASSAGRWRGCPPTPPRSPTAGRES